MIYIQVIPWHRPLMPSWNPLTQRFQFNVVGLFLTTWGLRLLEFLFLAPKGTSKIQRSCVGDYMHMTSSAHTCVRLLALMRGGHLAMPDLVSFQAHAQS